MRDPLTSKQILERNRTSLNARDLAAYLDNQTPDVVLTMADGTVIKGRDAIKPFMEALWQAFPDGKLTFGEQVLADDSAAVEVTFEGTHTGRMFSPNGVIEPTNKHVKGTSVSLLKIRDGKIASERIYGDPLGMMRQLGLVQ